MTKSLHEYCDGNKNRVVDYLLSLDIENEILYCVRLSLDQTESSSTVGRTDVSASNAECFNGFKSVVTKKNFHTRYETA